MKRGLLLWSLSVLLLSFASGGAADTPERQLPEISWQDAAAHYGQECVVVGQVVMTKNIGSMCFLNFHRDFRGNFTAVIKKSSFHRFPEPPETLYADKHVRVTGRIIEYKGKPEIIVTEPDQIVILTGPGGTPVVDTAKVASTLPARPAATDEVPKTPPTPRVQAPPFDGTVTIASYNVLNLFDNHDCPYHRDEGTPPKPADELEKLAATIRAVNADVLALQEVENRGFLAQFNKAMLSDMGYDHVVLFEGNDKRGIDVAVLSRLPVGPVTSYRHVTYRNPDGQTARFRRDFIRVRVEPPKAQGFDVFVLHLKSKRGGEASTIVRMGEATAARRILDEILEQNSEACFVLCGDLNDTFDSEPIRALVGTGVTALKTFFSDIPDGQRITYNKEPYLNMIDFILCSPAMARRYEPHSQRVYAGSVEESGSDHNPTSARFNLR